MREPILLAVMGQTASGKTKLAEDLADLLGAQLVNADTFQAYRGLDIGTAKPENRSHYELLDIKDPNEPFGLGEWVAMAATCLRVVYEQGRSAVVVGGSGINVRALFEGFSSMKAPPPSGLREHLNNRMMIEGLDALAEQLKNLDRVTYEQIDLKNPVRVTRAIERALSTGSVEAQPLPPFRKVKMAIEHEKDSIESRIASRAQAMVDEGWLKEVETLRIQGYRPTAPALRAHGYREMWRVLEGEIELMEALESTVNQVRRYAKRQRTWLRREPGLNLLHAESDESPMTQACKLLANLGEGDS